MNETAPTTEPLIGPLTAAEWCAFRLTGDDNDLLQCCAVTSAFRDALFDVLRMGAGKQFAPILLEAWDAMEDHGFPEGVPQIEKLRAYYFPELASGQQETPADLPGFRGAGDCEPCQGTGLNIGLPGNCPVCGGTGNAPVHAEELDEHGRGTGHARCDQADGTLVDGPIADSTWQVTCEKCLTGEAESDADDDGPAIPSRHLYRKKPVTIRAVQVRWSTWSDVCDLLGPALKEANPNGARYITADEASDTCGEPGPEYIAFEVRTVHGELATVRHGDWVIPEKTPCRFYPCKPDVFAETYEHAPTAEPLSCGESVTSWHTLRVFDAPDLFFPEKITRQYQETHPAECHTLPAGARCWFAIEELRHQHRDQWPEPGTYRVRLEARVTGNGEEPDYETFLVAEPVEPVAAEQPTRKPVLVGTGMPQTTLLEAFGQWVRDAFGHHAYHVGSSLHGKTWRDVDVRLILPDDEFDALFPGYRYGNQTDAKWGLLCAALSTLGAQQTGLPIDFQIQSMTEANGRFGDFAVTPRNPLHLFDHYSAQREIERRAESEPTT